jgi:parallel beta-helix repeat protein
MNRVCIRVLIITVGLASQLWAGSLNPPAAPGATMKTMTEVEPRIAISADNTPGDPNNTYIISQPGSYYLTGNFVSNFKHGILVKADNVTLDLMGYQIKSSWYKAQSSQNTTFHGIKILDRCRNITIRNGTIFSDRFVNKGFYHGIAADAGTIIDSVRIINVDIFGSRYDGIYLYDATEVLADSCTVKNCVGNGMMIGKKSVVKNCNVSGNGNAASSNVFGIYIRSGSMVTENTVCGNGVSATCNRTSAIVAGEGCVIAGNTITDNGYLAAAEVHVISTYAGCKVADNIVRDNGASAGDTVIAIDAGDGCTISGNTVTDNGKDGEYFVYGINAGKGCTVTGNTVTDNGSSAANTVWGMAISSYSLINQNTCYRNGSGAPSAMSLYAAPGCVLGQNVAP